MYQLLPKSLLIPPSGCPSNNPTPCVCPSNIDNVSDEFLTARHSCPSNIDNVSDAVWLSVELRLRVCPSNDNKSACLSVDHSIIRSINYYPTTCVCPSNIDNVSVAVCLSNIRIRVCPSNDNVSDSACVCPSNVIPPPSTIHHFELIKVDHRKYQYDLSSYATLVTSAEFSG